MGVPQQMSGPTVTARVLALLGAFTEQHPRRTLTELARTAELPVSTAHRLLQSLQQWGAVERDTDGRFCVGRRLWQLGTLTPVHRELREIALPSMLDLYEATHENVHLAVRSGTAALYLERLHGRNSVPLVSRAGRPLPLHTTGVGKVLLAWADDDVRERCLADLRQVTRYSIRERGRMLRELSAVRDTGYARTVEEMTLGTWSVAVPVFGPDGTVVAAIGLVTRTLRRDLTNYVPALQVAASAIARGIGTADAAK